MRKRPGVEQRRTYHAVHGEAILVREDAVSAALRSEGGRRFVTAHATARLAARGERKVTYEEVAPGEADGLVVRGDDRAVHAVGELVNLLREDASLWDGQH